MRLKDLLLQGEQSKCVLAAVLEIGVQSLCVAAADTVLSEWSEGLARSSPSTAEPRVGAEHHVRVPGHRGACWGASGAFVLSFSPAGLG